MEDVTMPNLGYDMEEGKVVSWLKKVGDKVERGEPIAEIETDKTTVEMEAMANLTADAATSRIAAVLPPDQAEVLLLRVLGDLSVKQVAAVVGKRPGAVRALQHRALSRLSRDLSPEPVTR